MDNFKQYIAKRITNLKALAKEKRESEKQEFLNDVMPKTQYQKEALEELGDMQVDKPYYNEIGEKLPF